MNQENDIWWLNDESEQILNRGYLLKGESVEGAIERITSAAAKRLYKPELQPAFKEMITKGWISFSSPILRLFNLTSHHNVTRRFILQKARSHP